MHEELSLKETQKEYHGSYKAYFIGFILSLILTLISFGLVVTKAFSGQTLLYIISGLALTQAVVQLIFFMHVGQEEKPRWGLIIFYFMVVILVIIVFGTLWIMNDLNMRMMPMDMSHD
jgi:cytochrome o ubiquinol oxidase operon protein cyoD